MRRIKTDKKYLAGFLALVMAFGALVPLPIAVLPAFAEGDAGASASGPVAADYAGIIISEIYGNNAKTDGVAKYGFIELYNTTDADIDMTGMSLYYGSKKYKELSLDGYTIAAHGYFLIRGACSEDFEPEVIETPVVNPLTGEEEIETSFTSTTYKTSGEYVRLTNWDLVWEGVKIDNEEVALVLAVSGRSDIKGSKTTPREVTDTVDYFCASLDYTFDTHYLIDDISKNKFAVRAELQYDSGWYTVKLSEKSTEKLESVLPHYSGGTAAEVRKVGITEITFNYKAGVYDNPIDLELGCSKSGVTVYYTTDGSDPLTSATRTVYTSPIRLADSTAVAPGPTTTYAATLDPGYGCPSLCPGGYVIKAAATWTKSGETKTTAVFTSTYFIGSEFKDYGMTVMSISMDKRAFVSNGPTADGFLGFYNNFDPLSNDSHPRSDGVIEVFDADGERRGYSLIQASVTGHASTVFKQRGFKIFFKKAAKLGLTGSAAEGGWDSDLEYDLFGGNAVNQNGQTITEFSNLILRVSGNEYADLMLRDAYEQRISADLDADTAAYTPVLVFINGEFWGLYNCRERYSDDYVATHYGVDKDNVVWLENDYDQVHTDLNADFVVASAPDDLPGCESIDFAASFNDLVDFIRTHDLSIAENYEYVESQLDFASFIDMYAAHYFFNATDWPENNIRIWRNASDLTGLTDVSGVDGKWHFTLHDMDFGLGLWSSSHQLGDMVYTNPEQDLMSTFSNRACVLGTVMRELMNNPDFKERFLGRMYEVLCTEYGDTDALEAVLDEMLDEREPVWDLQTARWHAGYLGLNAPSDASVATGTAVVKDFVERRDTYYVPQLCRYFGVSRRQLAVAAGLPYEDDYEIIAASFDTIATNAGNLVSQQAGNWLKSFGNMLQNVNGVYTYFELYGWVGFDQAISAFGYQINDEAPVFSNDFTVTPEPQVRAAGGDLAKRFRVRIPALPASSQEACVVVMLESGDVIRLDSAFDEQLGSPDSCDTSYQLVRSYWTVRTQASVGNSNGNTVIARALSEQCVNTVILSLGPRLTCDMTGHVGDTLTLEGWHADPRGVAAFGYRVDDGELITDASFVTETSSASAITSIVATLPNACAFKEYAVSVPVTGGNHTVTVFAISNGQDETLLWTVTLTDDNGQPEPETETETETETEPETVSEVRNVPEGVSVSAAITHIGYDADTTDYLPAGADPDDTELGTVNASYIAVYGTFAVNMAVKKVGYRYGADPVWTDDGTPTEATASLVVNDVGEGTVYRRFRIEIPVSFVKADTQRRQVCFICCKLDDGSTVDLWKIGYTPTLNTVDNGWTCQPDGDFSQGAVINGSKPDSRVEFLFTTGAAFTGIDTVMYVDTAGDCTFTLKTASGQVLESHGLSFTRSHILSLALTDVYGAGSYILEVTPGTGKLYLASGREPVGGPVCAVFTYNNLSIKNEDFSNTPFLHLIPYVPTVCEHDWSDWSITDAPTCTETGSSSRTCPLCHEVETREEPATGHTFGTWATTGDVKLGLPTTEQRACANCDAVETRTGPVPNPWIELTNDSFYGTVWQCNNATYVLTNYNGLDCTYFASTNGSDPFVVFDLYGNGHRLSANTNKYLRFEYLVVPGAVSSKATKTEFFVCSTGGYAYPDAGARVDTTLIRDGNWHVASIDLTNASFWSGDVLKVRIDFFVECAAGDGIYIRRIAIDPQ